MIPENQKDIIMQALITASFSDKFAFYQFTVHDVKYLSEILHEIMIENGFKIYKERDTNIKLIGD